jgi:hypothetical protein
MWNRTLTIGSAGKAFCSTGIKVINLLKNEIFLNKSNLAVISIKFKIGWTIGPKELVMLLETTHNNTINSCPTFFQVNYLNAKLLFGKYLRFFI